MPDPNSIHTIAVFGVLMMLLIVGFFVLFIFKYRSRQVEHKREKEILAAEMTRAQFEIQEQTIHNISMEIHDNIGQTLTLAKLQINSMEPENLIERKAQSRELITRAVQSLRDLSKSMNGDYVLELGLEASIERELNMVSASGTFETSFEDKGPEIILTEQTEVILFRCIQETINNAVKHSMGTKISVDVERNVHQMKISVTDNGVGISEDPVKGLGLHNLERRIKIIGGKMLIDKGNKKGTNLIFTLPTHPF